MSALFGKTDHKKVLQAYVDKGEFERALKFAVKVGDKFYDEDKIEEAIGTYLLLLELMEGKDVSNHALYEKLYEKLIPLLFEEGREEDALKYSLLLVNEKIVLKKDKEAFDILSALESQFPDSAEVVLKKVELYLNNGDSQSALNSLNNAIASIGPNPKFIELSGEILLKLHKYQDAYDYFNALLAVDPDNEMAKQRISELELALKISKISSEKMDKKESKVENVSKGKESVNSESTEKNKTGNARNVLNELKKETTVIHRTITNKNANTKETISKTNIKKTQEVVPKDKQQKNENKEDFSENKKISAPVTNSNQSAFVDKQKPLLKVIRDPMYVSALQIFLKGEANDYNALLSVAEKYETINLIDAEYIYLKLFLTNPRNVKVAHKLISLYDKIATTFGIEEIKNEKLFTSAIAVKNSTGEDKLGFLREIEKEVPDELFVKTQIFKTLSLLGKKEEAIQYFRDIKDKIDKKSLSELAEIAFPAVKDDVNSLEEITLILYRKGINTKVSFKYFYALGNILFNAQNKPDGLKWLLRANAISKLSLDDYVKIAEYVKDLPLDEEKDAIATALNGYIDVVNNDKKDYLFKLILTLKPQNTLYIRRYIEFLSTQGRTKEEANLLKFLIKKKDLNAVDFIGSKLKEVESHLSAEDLKEIENLFDIAKYTSGLLFVYDLMLRRDPLNKEVMIKHLVICVEMEDEKGILQFFKRNEPAHQYMKIVSNKIAEYEQLRLKSMLDYHVHFVLGFLYYLVERFEESIASFQFVVRSHRFEPLMHLFLGLSFEKIALPDFAIKQYQSILEENNTSEEITSFALYRMAVISKRAGDLDKALDYAKRSYSMVKDQAVQEILETIPKDSGDKIIKMEEKSE